MMLLLEMLVRLGRAQVLDLGCVCCWLCEEGMSMLKTRRSLFQRSVKGQGVGVDDQVMLR